MVHCPSKPLTGGEGVERFQISAGGLREVQQAFGAYTKLIESSSLADDTKRTYTDRVDRFIRWLEGKYEPPARRPT